jgi:hypothetical protein
MQKMPNLKNQVVRDLAWSCFGPNLINTFLPTEDQESLQGEGVRSLELDLTAERNQWLLELDQNPEPIFIHLSHLKSRRLGLYFEALWHFFLMHDSQLELIAHNIPIRSDQRTLGKLDIIYRDKPSGAFTHLELAVKFYLNYQTIHCSSKLIDFLGPKGKDRLDKKIDRILSHQSPLSDTTEEKKTLSALGIHAIQKKIALKGWLFYYEPLQPSAENSHPLSNHHQKGRWNHLSAFRETAHQHKHWAVLEKRNWLSPATILDADKNGEHTLLTADQLITFLGETFKTDQRPRMVCPMTQSHPMIRETERYFITPDNWPVKDF